MRSYRMKGGWQVEEYTLPEFLAILKSSRPKAYTALEWAVSAYIRPLLGLRHAGKPVTLGCAPTGEWFCATSWA